MGLARITIPFTPFAGTGNLAGTAWARHYWPNQFSRPFTGYQEEFWEWGWSIEADVKYRPRIECEPRGVGKSTNTEAWIASLLARKKRKMIAYVSLDEDKATKHFDAIKGFLETPAFIQQYPHCRPKVQELKNTAAQWSRKAIITRSNAMIVPLSLRGSSRGWKSPTGERFDLIILDDIDKLGMSEAVIAGLIDLLKGEILAAGNDKTLVVMPQNLIHRDSICARILDHRADILSDRDFRGPFKLLKWYDAEKVDLEGDRTGAKQWRITAGEPVDNAISIEYAESLLNLYGKSVFDRECQQDVQKVEADKDFQEWSEQHHVITYSEFRRYFEDHKITVWSAAADHPIIPHNWNVGLGLDWGCLTLDTEILTKRGWKKHFELIEGEPVAGYDWADKQKIVWTPLLKKVYKHDQPLIEMSRKSFKFRCTPDHAWIVRRKKRGKMKRHTYRRQNFDTIAKNQTQFVIAAECKEPGLIDCKPAIAAVLGWLVTDGWTQKKPGKRMQAILCQKNYPEEVIRDLEASGLPWNEIKTTKNGTRLFSLGADGYESLCDQTGYTGKACLPELVTQLSPEARQAMMRAMLLAEGTKNGTKRYAIFCQKRGPEMDAFQILATLCGHRLGVEREHESGYGNSQRIPILRHQHITYPDVTEVPGLHEVWCPSVKEGAVIARYQGQISITGNTTIGHPAACAPMAVPNEGSPLEDCYFAFTEIILPHYPLPMGEDPPAVSPGRVSEAINAGLAEWNVQDSQIVRRVMSHEASAALNTMAIDLKEDQKQFFQKWKAKRGSGVPQLQQAMEIDWSKPHPFRTLPDGRPLMGRPRFFLIVPNDQGRLITGDYGSVYVAQPRDYKGLARARFEIPLYSHRAQGKSKLNDDWVDGALGLANVFVVPNKPMSPKERRESRLPAALQNKEELAEKVDTATLERINLQRTVEFNKMDQQDAAARAKLSKYRPTVPRIGAMRRR